MMAKNNHTYSVKNDNFDDNETLKAQKIILKNAVQGDRYVTKLQVHDDAKRNHFKRSPPSHPRADKQFPKFSTNCTRSCEVLTVASAASDRRHNARTLPLLRGSDAKRELQPRSESRRTLARLWMDGRRTRDGRDYRRRRRSSNSMNLFPSSQDSPHEGDQ